MFRSVLLISLALALGGCAKLSPSFQDSGSDTGDSADVDSSATSVSAGSNTAGGSHVSASDSNGRDTESGGPTDPTFATSSGSHGSGTTNDSDSTSIGSTSFAETGDPPVCIEPSTLRCSPYEESSCPEGQTCRPYDEDGDGTSETTGCFEIYPPNDSSRLGARCRNPCGLFGGEDSCGLGQMCFPFSDFGPPRCVALCHGSPEEPSCDEGTCVVFPRGDDDAPLFGVCRGSCNQRDLDCPVGQVCVFHVTGPLCEEI